MPGFQGRPGLSLSVTPVDRWLLEADWLLTICTILHYKSTSTLECWLARLQNMHMPACASEAQLWGLKSGVQSRIQGFKIYCALSFVGGLQILDAVAETCKR